MANLILPPSWRIVEKEATPEAVYFSRRLFLQKMGFAGVAALALSSGMASCANAEPAAGGEGDILAGYAKLPHLRNERFNPDRPTTEPRLSTRYNNAYEFTTDKERVWKLARDFRMKPWEVEVGGLCEQQGTFDYTELVNMAALEERLYRFRCVEAWAMTVPWLGVPFRSVVDWAKPTDKATHVRFVSVLRPKEMQGQRDQPWYPWPYYEGLRLDEARNELSFLTVGLYGRELPPQNGGPLRMIVPWKYGYKSPKYIKRIEFVDYEPKTFWNDLAPTEYGFLSNVSPEVPHPRWSQATEELIGEDRRVPTRKFNGYGDSVAGMYAGK